MAVLVTGGSGFLGRVFVRKLLAAGIEVYALSRHPPPAQEGLVPIKGDVLEPDLGISRLPDITAVYHLASIPTLGSDRSGVIYRTNVQGTQEVIDYCINYDIPHLYYVSTAYTQGRNPYERSKSLCEILVKKSDIPRVTIFKPSIIVGIGQDFFCGHVAQFFLLAIRVHRRMELVRRKIERTLHLPVIEPSMRIKGLPRGRLNLIPVAQVADAMVHYKDPGTYWLTNPNPPCLQDIFDWAGEYIMVKITAQPEFEPTRIESMFARQAAAFAPYQWGDDFPTHIKGACPITREFLQTIIKESLD